MVYFYLATVVYFYSALDTIGFILPDISNSFFGMLTLGIEKVLRKNDYRLIPCNTNARRNLEELRFDGSE